MKMAGKALAWSGSSAAPLVSSSSRTSSGVKALCFAPRSVSFPAKKISPLVNVIRAQKKEDSHTDDQDQRSSGQNQSDAAQGRPARESTRDIDLDDDSEFGEPQSLATKLTQLMDIYQGMRSSDQNKRRPARESTRDIDLDDDSEFAELQSMMTELIGMLQGKRSSDQNQSAAGKRCPARESARDIDLDELRNMSKHMVDRLGSPRDEPEREPWRHSMTEKEYVVSCDMPGVDASELEVMFVGIHLIIMFKGPKDKVDALGRKITGLYDTSIVLSADWVREKAEAEFRNGTLYVRIPRLTIDHTVPIYVPVRVV